MKCHCFFIVAVFIASFCKSGSGSTKCVFECPPEEEMVCGFDAVGKTYKMFDGKCSFAAYSDCYKIELVQTPLKHCIKYHFPKETRRVYGESCPVFCPEYYRPVCGAAKIRDYSYRTFINRCFMDMVNCRGSDESEPSSLICRRKVVLNYAEEYIIVHHVDLGVGVGLVEFTCLLRCYIEVPLSNCQNHLMKNIFKEQVVVANMRDHQDN